MHVSKAKEGKVSNAVPSPSLQSIAFLGSQTMQLDVSNCFWNGRRVSSLLQQTFVEVVNMSFTPK